MASTRNNNTESDYKLQQLQYDRSRNYMICPENDTIIKTSYPEFGVNFQKAPSSNLSYNATDIESVLFGINSTNLVRPADVVKGELKELDVIKYHNRVKMLVPKFHELRDQRPKIN